MTADRPATEPQLCATCKHISHGGDWCSETVLTGSSTQEMCGCPPAESIQPAQNQADLDKARAALAEAAQEAAPHPRTYSLVGGGLDIFLVTDDESGLNIGYARKIGGPLTRAAQGAAPLDNLLEWGRRWIESDGAPDGAAPLDVDRLTAIIESRMSRDLAWLADDGKTVNRLGPEQIAHALMHLHRTGDVVSGLPPLEGAAPLDDTECICASLAASDLRSLRWQREFGFDPLCPVDHDPRPEEAAPLDEPCLHWSTEDCTCEGAAPRAEGPPDNRTCLTHPRQVAHDWHHQSYEGTWLCHCTVCGIVPNRAAPRAEGLLEAATALADATAAEHADCTSDHCHWCPLVDAIRAALKAYDKQQITGPELADALRDDLAAPRAEGLDVLTRIQAVARRWLDNTDPDARDAMYLIEQEARAALSRPSDKRVPEEESR